MTVLIALSQGLHAIVDDCDAARVTQFKWAAKPVGRRTGGFYGFRSMRKGGAGQGKTTVYLHRFILNAPANLLVDHINADGLDNRRCNLRLVTASQNCANRNDWARASGFRGVYPTRSGKWCARISLRGRFHTLGTFECPEAAALTYNAAAVEAFGDAATLNVLGVSA